MPGTSFSGSHNNGLRAVRDAVTGDLDTSTSPKRADGCNNSTSKIFRTRCIARYHGLIGAFRSYSGQTRF